MDKSIYTEMEKEMKEVLSKLKSEFVVIRTGRASASLLDKIYVDYYGSPVPINQIASISVPEPKMIVIQPWDIKMLGVIEKAILKSDLRLTPNNDGKVIRLVLPELTSERRQELLKLAKKKAEEARVSIRNIRREYNENLKKMEKSGEISEDELKRSQEEIQKLTDKYIEEVDKMLAAKETDIMEV
ncbi:ribosome-recycling factor [Tepidanaerobacter syntrophicus]|uniref:Ribosome-recycling factor n=2 Tax=Tepidanaerobacteraceae TaxID=2770092 RepID=A0A0U9HH68_9FIRM|nr:MULTISPECIES: ribosome recycling factor [Tepidanaerobacter]GAQ26224.1 ribosome recycling factor [Tepidanaerobacter syntrophicus]GLI19212.1 ribosome-recycling factor [Tepidanaerobacter syntrophicus]GLI50155.1 ribosome-recycling factor [Tepidanaerobacter syntrophicus]